MGIPQYINGIKVIPDHVMVLQSLNSAVRNMPQGPERDGFERARQIFCTYMGMNSDINAPIHFSPLPAGAEMQKKKLKKK